MNWLKVSTQYKVPILYNQLPLKSNMFYKYAPHNYNTESILGLPHQYMMGFLTWPQHKLKILCNKEVLISILYYKYTHHNYNTESILGLPHQYMMGFSTWPVDKLKMF